MSKESLVWWGYDITRPNQYNRCIKQLVKICRITLEYNEWQKESKRYGGDTCPICDTDYTYAPPETHHYPLTMYEIVEHHLQEHIQNNTLHEITPLELIKEVMGKHLTGDVSYVVLCKYCHDKFHNQDPEIIKKLSEHWRNRGEKQEQD